MKHLIILVGIGGIITFFLFGTTKTDPLLKAEHYEPIRHLPTKKNGSFWTRFKEKKYSYKQNSKLDLAISDRSALTLRQTNISLLSHPPNNPFFEILPHNLP